MSIRVRDQVAGFLASLPDSPDRIAEFLEHEGIKGVDQDANRCVLAIWLRTQLSGRGRDSAWIGVSAEAIDCDGILLEPPQHISQFIDDFDGGIYPWLIATDEVVA
jgi:hypothetical protein